MNSYELILILFPLTLLLYFTAGRINLTVRKLIVCLSGAAFYYFAGFKAMIVLGGSIIANFFVCEMMLETEKLKKLIMYCSVLMNAGVLIVFRYGDFAISTVNDLLGKEINLLYLNLPLGLCFFTLQQIAYVVSIYRGKVQLKFLDYLAYVLYFPKLILGPLAEPDKIISEMNDPMLSHWNWDNCVSGIKMFSFGLFKKLVIADTFALAVSWGDENIYIATSLDMFIVMLCYTFEIYFDFSGYSDMAIGLSKMLNISLPQNFDSPYKAYSFRDISKRWYMSMSSFMQEYLYKPLGGSKKGKIRTCLNVMIVCTLCGIWHGNNLLRIIWGVIIGLLVIVERFAEPVLNKVPKFLRWIVTFGIVNVLWLLFRASSISDFVYELKVMLLRGTFTVSRGLTLCFRGVEMPFFEDMLNLGGAPFSSGLAWMAMYLAAAFIICLVFKNNHQLEKKNGYIFMILSAVAFAWSFLFLGAETTSIFNFM